MIRLLLRPLPDELLTSALIRTCRRIGVPIHTLMTVLTGGRKWAPTFFQAGHLNDIAESLGMSSLSLLHEHTVFPYATAFYADAAYDASLRSALSIGRQAVGHGSTTQSVSDRVPVRRYCAQCIQEDMKAWGESYWHRAHNLPGVIVCTKHARVLRATAISTGRGWSDALPHDRRAERLMHTKPTRFEVKLAFLSVALLDRRERPETADAAWYRSALVKKGLLSAARVVSIERVTRWLRGNVAPPERFGLRGRDTSLAWAALMLRPGVDMPYPALKHLLLQAAIEVQEPVNEPLLDYVPVGTGRKPIATSYRDRVIASAVLRTMRECESTGQQIRVADALQSAGHWHAFRHDRAKFPRTQRAVSELRQSAASIRRKTPATASEP